MPSSTQPSRAGATPALRFFAVAANKLFGPAALAGLALVSAQVMAHSPGLSTVKIELGSPHIVVTATFARADLFDGNSPEAVLTQVTGDTLVSLAAVPHDVLEARAGQRTLPFELTAVTPVGKDGLALRYDVNPSGAKQVTFSFPLLQRMASGHRHLVFLSANKVTIESRILTREQPSLQVSLRPARAKASLLNFIYEGVRHIWIGFDHLIFLIALLIPAVLSFSQFGWHPASRLAPVIKDTASVVTAFTAAHSLTLAAAALGWFYPPPVAIEIAIAVTVIIVAGNNIWPFLRCRRWHLAFGLGLVHGFGFASVLAELGLSAESRTLALAGFNIGVELGQLVIVLMVVPLLFKLRRWRFYVPGILRGGSTAIAVTGMIWLVERSI